VHAAVEGRRRGAAHHVGRVASGAESEEQADAEHVRQRSQAIERQQGTSGLVQAREELGEAGRKRLADVRRCEISEA
jgi:succinate dehydrogenase/fumarate reductase flavoprotein subunit